MWILVAPAALTMLTLHVLASAMTSAFDLVAVGRQVCLAVLVALPLIAAATILGDRRVPPRRGGRSMGDPDA